MLYGEEISVAFMIWICHYVDPGECAGGAVYSHKQPPP